MQQFRVYSVGGPFPVSYINMHINRHIYVDNLAQDKPAPAGARRAVRPTYCRLLTHGTRTRPHDPFKLRFLPI